MIVFTYRTNKRNNEDPIIIIIFFLNIFTEK